jgi:uncharacterized protein (DUF433 family)
VPVWDAGEVAVLAGVAHDDGSRSAGAAARVRAPFSRYGATSSGVTYRSTTMDAMGRKCAPFSLRFSEETDRLVTAEAKRTKRSKGYVVEALVEEALKTRLVRGIAFRGEDHNRRAWLVGTSLDVWQVVEAYEDFEENFERVLRETELTERELRTALSYYQRFPQEIDDLIALDRRPLAELRAEFPQAEVVPIEFR